MAIKSEMNHEIGHVIIAENLGFKVYISVIDGQKGFTVAVPNDEFIDDKIALHLWIYVDSGLEGIAFKRKCLQDEFNVTKISEKLMAKVYSLIKYIIAGSVAEGMELGSVQGENDAGDRAKYEFLKKMFNIDDDKVMDIFRSCENVVNASLSRYINKYNIADIGGRKILMYMD